MFCPPKVVWSILRRSHYQTGFMLIDTLIALLLFTIMLHGIMNYQQAQLRRFSYHNEEQQAWRLAQQLLDIYPASSSIRPLGWQITTQIIATLKQCNFVEVRITTTRGIQATLQRWYCGIANNQ